MIAKLVKKKGSTTSPVEEICRTTSAVQTNNFIIMKPKEDSDNIYNEESPLRDIPNDGLEEIEIEPLNWNDM